MRIGPKLTISASCLGCTYERSERYRCQGDSGHDVYCAHPSLIDLPQDKRHVGDTTWATPHWCPVRA
jgi:hypothetical protein